MTFELPVALSDSTYGSAGFYVRASADPLYDSTFFGLFIGTLLLAAYLTHPYFEAPAQRLIRAVAAAERSEGDCPGPRPLSGALRTDKKDFL